MDLGFWISSHPDHLYGFLARALAFQFVFLAIATNPPRYRALIPACIIEKWLYAALITWLYATHRAPAVVFGFAIVDAVLGVTFVAAFLGIMAPPDR